MSVSQQKKFNSRPNIEYINGGIKIRFSKKPALDKARQYLITKYNLKNLVINQSSSSSFYSSYYISTDKKPIKHTDSSNTQEYSIIIPKKELKKLII
jgi:hypothetical protein